MLRHLRVHKTVLLHCDIGCHNVSMSVVHKHPTDNTFSFHFISFHFISCKGSLAFITSVVDESQQPSSKHSHGNIKERASVTHWIRG